MKTKQDKLHEAFEFLRSKGVVHTQKEFSEQIGFDKSNLSSAFKGSERYLTDGLFKKICDTYPDFFRIDYFLTGEGSMLKESDNFHTFDKSNVIRYWKNIDVAGGNIEFFDDEPSDDFIPMVIPEFKGCTDAVNIWGDSMSPRYKNGQIIILKKWEESFIDYGNAYLVITRNGHKIVKYLRRSNNPEEILCASENPDFDTFPIMREDIVKIYIVKGSVEKSIL